ncbi:MAG: diguanylate cyclase [Pseudomonadota bacterium]
MDDIILCVDDDTTVLNALRTLLSKQLGQGHLIEIAESGAEALDFFEELRERGQEASVVICDYIMPGMRGDELLVRLHELCPNTVKILLTGQSDLEGVKRAINGANLYRFLEKPFDNADIVLTARTASRAYRAERELEHQNEQLRHINANLELLVAQRTAELEEKNRALQTLSITDRLTGLFNRLRLDQVLEHEAARCERLGGDFALILLDIDKFKSVNDTHGHQVGDQVLMAMAQVLRRCTRELDIVGRWGGEEFLVVASGTDGEGARALAEKLREAVAEHDFPVVGSKSASFGVAAFRAGDSIEGMMARADAALYRAKEGGRNRVECAHP